MLSLIAPVGPEENMGLGLTILNQREVYIYNYVQVKRSLLR
jgi:hypothetical protein